jgi:GMP synthase (glutamine-hydrolysing)
MIEEYGMRIHYLQHVPFEGPAFILSWATARKASVTHTLLYKNEECPPAESFDCLVVMGGPMGVHDETTYPWLTEEKALIESAIAAGKKVLGICLGAQLLALVLGAKVGRNAHREIGWFPVSRTIDGLRSPLMRPFPEEFMAFHWHGDTFDIPKGAVHCAASEVCAHQAFIYNNTAVGFQYHLESTPESIRGLIQNCSSDIVAGRFVQTAEVMLAGNGHCAGSNELMAAFLDGFFLPQARGC